MYIYAWAKPRKDIVAQLEGVTRPIILHLIKLWLYPDSQDRNKWRTEVANYLDEVPAIKGKHKFPSAQLICDSTWSIHQHRFSYYVEVVSDDYGYADCDEVDLQSAVASYFMWISELLAEYGMVSHDRIYNMLDTLGF